LAQDFENFELIISDNASTDGTQEICQSFAEKDSRIRYSRNKTNIGLAANHNRTFELSRVEFFKWAAYDDDFPPTMLRRFVDVRKAHRCLRRLFAMRVYRRGNVVGIDSGK
jgi:glycosyltransferase involved in cell wall biosynthesis